jgi:predicted nucleic acid-binding protein
MSDFVLDASATLAFVFPDERDASAIALARSLRTHRAAAPTIWRLEVENAIVTAERAGRLASERATVLLEDIAALPIDLREPRAGYLAPARRFKLSVYDALYLELAERLRIPLVSRDRALRHAARRLGVQTATGVP